MTDNAATAAWLEAVQARIETQTRKRPTGPCSEVCQGVQFPEARRC